MFTSTASEKMKNAMKMRNRPLTKPAITSARTYLKMLGNMNKASFAVLFKASFYFYFRYSRVMGVRKPAICFGLFAAI